MIYDVGRGALVETEGDRLLTEEELADARERFAAGEKVDAIAKRLKAKPFKAAERDTSAPHVAVAWDDLVEAVGEEEALRLSGLPAK